MPRSISDEYAAVCEEYGEKSEWQMRDWRAEGLRIHARALRAWRPICATCRHAIELRDDRWVDVDTRLAFCLWQTLDAGSPTAHTPLDPPRTPDPEELRDQILTALLHRRRELHRELQRERDAATRATITAPDGSVQWNGTITNAVITYSNVTN